MAVPLWKLPSRCRRVEGQMRVGKTHSHSVKADLRRHLIVNDSKVTFSRRTAPGRRASASADEGAFVFDNPMAGYEAKLTPERPTDDACERRVVAGCTR
jgi:hypothetical protein